MCIAVFMWQAHPKCPFLLLHNRDEFYSRPTEALAWWGEETILGGRDGLGGGTWLGSTRDGRIAFLTNFRERESLPHPKTRGDLPLRFLQSNKSPNEFAEEVLKEAHQYNGFNLILADICSSTMVYVCNRPKQDHLCVAQVTPGIHVLANATLDSPWPKAERLRHNFNELIAHYGESDFPIKEVVEKLMTNTIKDEDCMLPGIYPPERERPLSSIFVETEILSERYGTRSSSALFVKSNNEVIFYEKYLDQRQWKEKMVSYVINERE
ncbi:transport and Golgi organization 2 homolog isoform X2 [Abrus precatorius]|uniref:Transport and Golgi organization 2 homolog isoform X2 n=1 Tax=Abrus precatorius TaxID=3816 RepID=A0A8B8KUS7_ABRPR|nr:transport and Golgi organization 2 homolog isoform X2 [Abrus precatorius]